MRLRRKPEISWEDFEKVDIRCGTILSAEVFAEARQASYKLLIDFGPIGIKKSSAQITELYTAEELAGKQILAVVNFPPKQIANFMSECLVLGLVGEGKNVVLPMPSHKIADGLPLL